MRHEDIPPMSRQDAEAAFASGGAEAICRALLSAALHDPDWRWVQEQCLRCAGHPDAWVRRNAAIGLSHLARLHGVLELDKVGPVLKRLIKDPEAGGEAEDALQEIERRLGKGRP